MSDLGASAARGGVATIASGSLVLIANFIGLLVLSRMLDPWDFGIVAMVQAIISLGEIFKNAGLTTAALQERQLTEQQASNLFWVNAGLSAVTAAVIVASSGLIVTLYGEPLLYRIIPLMAVSLFANGLGAQIRVQLARRMKFGLLSLSSALSQAFGVISAIIMAASGLGYWALVGQTLVASIAALVVEASALRWLPSRFRRGAGTKRLVGVGMQYWVNDVLSFLQSNAATVVLGRKLGPVPLGNYNRASQVANLPVGGLLGPLMRVVLPVLNAAREAGRGVGPIVLQLQLLIGAAFLGVLAVSSGLSSRVVPLVLGSGWAAAAPVFAILALGAGVETLNYLCHWALMHFGRSRAILQFNLIARPAAIVGLLIGVGYGLQGAAVGFVLAQALTWPLNFIWIARLPSFPWKEFLIRGCYLAACALATALATRLILQLCEARWFDLLFSLVGGMVFFVLMLFLVPSLRHETIAGYKSLLQMVRR